MFLFTSAPRAHRTVYSTHTHVCTRLPGHTSHPGHTHMGPHTLSLSHTHTHTHTHTRMCVPGPAPTCRRSHSLPQTHTHSPAPVPAGAPAHTQVHVLSFTCAQTFPHASSHSSRLSSQPCPQQFPAHCIVTELMTVLSISTNVSLPSFCISFCSCLPGRLCLYFVSLTANFYFFFQTHLKRK